MSVFDNMLYWRNIEADKDNLLRPVTRAALKLSEDKSNQCAHQIYEMFQQWKKEHGKHPIKFDRLSQYRKYRANLNSDAAFNDAEPYECAGYGVSNYTDLAFKIWLDDYTPFYELCMKYSLPCVLAITHIIVNKALGSTANNLSSLIRLSCYLYEQEVEHYKILNNKKPNALNDEARKKGADANKHRSEQAKIQFRQAGRDAWRENPGFNYDQVTFELFKNQNIRKNIAGDMYSEGHIRRLIAGIKREL